MLISSHDLHFINTKSQIKTHTNSCCEVEIVLAGGCDWVNPDGMDYFFLNERSYEYFHRNITAELF
jgi:hypothetical protein